MGYVESSLNKNESVVARANFSWVAVVPAVIWLVLAVVGAFVGLAQLNFDGTIITYVKIASIVIGVLPMIVRVLWLALAALVITDRRVIGKVGIIKKESIDMPIHKVDNVSVKTSFVGRLLGYSTITIMSASGKTQFKLIGKADKFKNQITNAIEQAAEKARIEQAKAMAQAIKG